LNNQLGKYTNVQVNFIGGPPTAKLFDENDQVMGKVDLVDMDLASLKSELASHGFKFALPVHPKPSGASIDSEFEGYYYQLYKEPNDFLTAQEFAASLSKEGFGEGYLPVIYSQSQNEHLKQFLRANQVQYVWLGAGDHETEGSWKWLAGPLANRQFWEGDQSGSGVEGVFENWRDGEPNNVDDEDCAVLGAEDWVSERGSVSWNDELCEGLYHPILVQFGSIPVQQVVKATDPHIDL